MTINEYTCPCQFCLKRSEICHAHCIEYPAWVERMKARKEAMRKAKEKTSVADGFLCDQQKRIRRKQQAEWQKKYNESHKKG